MIDRFIDSTVAYQHFGMGIDLSIINKINNHLLDGFKVDFTFKYCKFKEYENKIKAKKKLTDMIILI